MDTSQCDSEIGWIEKRIEDQRELDSPGRKEQNWISYLVLILDLDLRIVSVFWFEC